jgi:hypothetical protein
VEEEEEETLRKSATEEEDIFGSSLVVFVRFSTLGGVQKCLKMLEKCKRVKNTCGAEGKSFTNKRE